MERSTNMPNIPQSWLPHSKKSINKRGGVRRGDWNKVGERDKREVRKTNSGEKEVLFGFQRGGLAT